MGPFFFEVPVPSNEEVDGTRNRPSPNVSISLHRPHKLGPLLPRLKTGRASVIFGHVPLFRQAQKETSFAGRYRSNRSPSGCREDCTGIRRAPPMLMQQRTWRSRQISADVDLTPILGAPFVRCRPGRG